MTIRMLINATAQNELRIAIVEDGELVELDIEAAETSTLKGNIYKGVVHNVEGSLEAAFVDIGAHKQGFLPFSEIAPSQFYRKWTSGDAPRINDVVRRGQEIIVQVSKDAIGEKGATLTTYLSIPGRYTVLMPNQDAGGISRKIEDEKVRKRIKSIAAKVQRPDNCGFIVRTAGLNQTRVGIQKDLDAVVEKYEKMQKAAAIARAPSVIYAEPDLIARTLRDFFNDEIDEVWIDNREEHEAAVQYFEDVMPDYTDRLHHYQNPIPIFAYYHVEEQIEATFERQVPLPSGGSIVLDQTEALVAVDVNSGRNTGERDHEETVFRTNCEAAAEVARQLKLRDLGGIVVVDFIDMELSKNKREVERLLAEHAKADKARYKISRINSKGICVLTRQRIRQGMRKAFQRRCEACSGTGWLRTAESHSLSLLRRVETRLAQGEVGEVKILTHRETAEYLSNHKRRELSALEQHYHCRILIFSRAEMDRGKDEVTYVSKGQILAEITDKLPAREERRSDRALKRKKRSKKKRSEEAPAPVPRAAVGSVVEMEDDEEPREKPSKRQRKKRVGAAAAPPAPQAPAAPPVVLEAVGGITFTGRPSPEMLAKLKAEREARRARRGGGGADATQASSDPAAGAEPREAPRNGRGESEVPQLVVAEARGSRGAPEVNQLVAAEEARRDGERSPPALDATVGADGDKARRSLLDRIFGSR